MCAVRFDKERKSLTILIMRCVLLLAITIPFIFFQHYWLYSCVLAAFSALFAAIGFRSWQKLRRIKIDDCDNGKLEENNHDEV